MPFIIVREDITKMNVDAIVNPANSTLLGSNGGTDGAIHKAAGKNLLEECKTLNGCTPGEAKITNGHNLPCKHIIHTVGPTWIDGKRHEEEILANCYNNSLNLALHNNIKSIAIPLIATGAYKFPKENAFKVATKTIENFLSKHDMTVYFVVFDNKAYNISQKLFDNVSQYIDDNYVELYESNYTRRRIITHYEKSADYHQSEDIYQRSSDKKSDSAPDGQFYEETELTSPPEDAIRNLSQVHFASSAPISRSLDEMLTNAEDTFSERLLKLIDLKNKTDVETYKKANIDRKLFSKIKSNKDYKPSKNTVLAFCFALELNLDETTDLLITSGFALSHSSKFDIIIEYFIANKIFNIFEVNETLFAFDQNLLGG